MITSFLDIFLMVTFAGGLGLFFLIYSLRIIKQMIVTGLNKTQENIDRLVKLAPAKHGIRKLMARKRFTGIEAYVYVGVTLLVSICAVIGCIGAFISVFS